MLLYASRSFLRAMELLVAVASAYHEGFNSGYIIAAVNNSESSWFRCGQYMAKLLDGARLPGRVAIPFDSCC